MRTLGKLLIGLLFLSIGNSVVADEPVRKQAELVQAVPEETATQSTETMAIETMATESLATETLATKAPAAPVEANGFVDALVNGKVKALFRNIILRQRPKISLM